MIPLICDPLPCEITAGRKRVRVLTDYRRWLVVWEVLSSSLTGRLKAELCSSAVVEGDVNLDEWEDLINAFAAFLLQKDSISEENCNNLRENSSIASYHGEKIFDFAADSELILASFLAEYGIDLTTEHMHWFKFMALLKSLSPDSPLMRTVRLRQTDASDIEDDRLRRQIRRAKNAVRIKEKERNDEQWTAL